MVRISLSSSSFVRLVGRVRLVRPTGPVGRVGPVRPVRPVGLVGHCTYAPALRVTGASPERLPRMRAFPCRAPVHFPAAQRTHRTVRFGGVLLRPGLGPRGIQTLGKAPMLDKIPPLAFDLTPQQIRGLVVIVTGWVDERIGQSSIACGLIASMAEWAYSWRTSGPGTVN